MLGKSIPSWLPNPGPVFLRNFVRNKGDSLCYKVEFIKSNLKFAHVHYKDGKECTVSTKNLAINLVKTLLVTATAYKHLYQMTTPKQIPTNLNEQQPEMTSNPPLPDELENVTEKTNKMLSQPTTPDQRHELRQSTQIQKPPICYGNPDPY